MIKLRILDDPRARQLLEELDARYFRFVDDLPSHLKRLALSEETIYGGQGEGGFKGPSTLNPLITCSPWLFWEAFSRLEDTSFSTIAEGGMFVSLYSVLLDHLVDNQAPQPGLNALLMQAFFQHGASCFREIFANNSPFWPSFDRYMRGYHTALGIEVDFQVSRQALSQDSFITSAGGKVEPMLTTVAALAMAADQERLISPIENSFRYSYIAGQLHDDILDWRDDLEKGHLTYVLTQLHPEGNSYLGELPAQSAIEQVVERERLDLQIYAMVIHWFDRACEAVEYIDCPGWLDYLQEYRGIAQEHQRACAAQHLLRELSPLF